MLFSYKISPTTWQVGYYTTGKNKTKLRYGRKHDSLITLLKDFETSTFYSVAASPNFRFCFAGFLFFF